MLQRNEVLSHSNDFRREAGGRIKHLHFTPRAKRPAGFLFWDWNEYSPACKGGKVNPLSSTRDNAMPASYPHGWTKQTRCSTSVVEGAKASELRRNQSHFTFTRRPARDGFLFQGRYASGKAHVLNELGDTGSNPVRSTTSPLVGLRPAFHSDYAWGAPTRLQAFNFRTAGQSTGHRRGPSADCATRHVGPISRPFQFRNEPHGGASHTVAETCGASPWRALRLAACEDGRLPAERERKVQARAGLDLFPFPLTLRTPRKDRALPCTEFFLGGSFVLPLSLSLLRYPAPSRLRSRTDIDLN